MTVDSGLSDEVRRFLSQNIRSIEQLEILLLLARTSPREWTVEQVAAELRVAAPSAGERLRDLERRGLVMAETGRHCFKRTEAETVVHQVAEAYRERRVAVIEFIFSKQASNIQVLADAFRVK